MPDSKFRTVELSVNIKVKALVDVDTDDDVQRWLVAHIYDISETEIEDVTVNDITTVGE